MKKLLIILSVIIVSSCNKKYDYTCITEVNNVQTDFSQHRFTENQAQRYISKNTGVNKITICDKH